MSKLLEDVNQMRSFREQKSGQWKPNFSKLFMPIQLKYKFSLIGHLAAEHNQ